MSENNINDLRKQLKELKENKLESCGFKKGDYVEYFNPEKPDKKFKGFIESLYVQELFENAGNLYMSIRGPKTYLIYWSGNSVGVQEENFKYVPKIENPVNLDNLSKLDGLIEKKRDEIDKATFLLKKQLNRLIKMKDNEERKCLHSFVKISDTGKIEKHLIGESNIYVYECSCCGKIVESC